MGNYNLKNIMLGIGIGLVISSMINISIGSKELTVEEIKKEAVKHNLIILSKEEIINNQPTTEESSLTQEAEAEQPVSEEKVEVNIISGMSSESVADLLKEKGLLNDTKAFLTRLEEVDKENVLKVGSFEIPKSSDFDEIIKIITE
jgi:hypothetical protein